MLFVSLHGTVVRWLAFFKPVNLPSPHFPCFSSTTQCSRDCWNVLWYIMRSRIIFASALSLCNEFVIIPLLFANDFIYLCIFNMHIAQYLFITFIYVLLCPISSTVSYVIIPIKIVSISALACVCICIHNSAIFRYLILKIVTSSNAHSYHRQTKAVKCVSFGSLGKRLRARTHGIRDTRSID